MAIKYINIFQSKAIQKCTQIGIFGLKINHLATLAVSTKIAKNISPLRQGIDGRNQSDQIGRIFNKWVVVYLG
jgi:hypothetical protein